MANDPKKPGQTSQPTRPADKPTDKPFAPDKAREQTGGDKPKSEAPEQRERREQQERERNQRQRDEETKRQIDNTREAFQQQREHLDQRSEQAQKQLQEAHEQARQQNEERAKLTGKQVDERAKAKGADERFGKRATNTLRNLSDRLEVDAVRQQRELAMQTEQAKQRLGSIENEAMLLATIPGASDRHNVPGGRSGGLQIPTSMGLTTPNPV